MNFIGVIILFTIVGDYFLNLVADMLNLSRLKKEIPESFRDVYDANRYHKSQAYLKENTRFGWISGTFDLLVFLSFWFAGGFAYLDSVVRSLTFGPIVTGMVYIGILAAIKTVVSLPFSIYNTFVIEERFGFNRTTVKTYILDMIKGLFLAIIFGGPLLAGILWFFGYTGAYAWLFCWFAVILFMLFIQYIAPRWLMPIFNKFTPLEEGELKTAIFAYADAIDFPLENVYVMDGSRRSSKSNAFFTGFGKNRRIVLFDTLIKQHSIDELVGILAHEMGHYKKKHILKSLILSILQTGLMFFLLSFFISYEPLFEAFYLENGSIYAGLIFFALLYEPLDFFMGLFLLHCSRKNEYEADRFAVETTGMPESLISALKKLSANNLSNLLPHPFYVFLNYSHPPVLERIRAIHNTMNDLPKEALRYSAEAGSHPCFPVRPLMILSIFLFLPVTTG